jgi:hypothetical protein
MLRVLLKGGGALEVPAGGGGGGGAGGGGGDGEADLDESGGSAFACLLVFASQVLGMDEIAQLSDKALSRYAARTLLNLIISCLNHGRAGSARSGVQVDLVTLPTTLESLMDATGSQNPFEVVLAAWEDAGKPPHGVSRLMPEARMAELQKAGASAVSPAHISRTQKEQRRHDKSREAAFSSVGGSWSQMTYNEMALILCALLDPARIRTTLLDASFVACVSKTKLTTSTAASSTSASSASSSSSSSSSFSSSSSSAAAASSKSSSAVASCNPSGAASKSSSAVASCNPSGAALDARFLPESAAQTPFFLTAPSFLASAVAPNRALFRDSSVDAVVAWLEATFQQSNLRGHGEVADGTHLGRIKQYVMDEDINGDSLLEGRVFGDKDGWGLVDEKIIPSLEHMQARLKTGPRSIFLDVLKKK